MEEKRRIVLNGGYALTHKDLTLFVPDFRIMADRLLSSTLAKQIFNTGTEPIISLDDWNHEIDRLGDIILKIVSDYPDKLDIFDYIPLTKSGKFHKQRYTLVADSNCLSSAIRGAEKRSFLRRYVIQVRICPYHSFAGQFTAMTGKDNARVLSLDWFHYDYHGTPIFDENGIPSKP